MASTLLIIGLGSAGRQYLRAAIEQGVKVKVFDTNAEVVSTLQESFRGNQITSLKTFPFDDEETENTVVIVATHSTARREIVERALNAGYSNILLEKLLFNSIQDLAWFDELEGSLEGKVKFLTHNRWDLLGLPALIGRFEEEYNLGKCVEFRSEGGRVCLATSAVHWLAFWRSYFGGFEKFSVQGQVDLGLPNARGDNLRVSTGTLTYTLGQSFRCHFSSSRQSALAPIVVFEYEFGRLVLFADGTWNLRTTDSIDLSGNRYSADHERASGKSMFDQSDSFSQAIRNMVGGRVDSGLDIRSGIWATWLIFVGLISSDRGGISLGSENLEEISHQKIVWPLT